MERHRVGIVIPAFNEAATIGEVVAGASKYGIAIVIDDGSSDATALFARAEGASVAQHDTNYGYDRALNSGFILASKLGCEYVVTMDADGQHDPIILPSFINALENGADVVIGIRDRRQRVAEVIFAWISSLKWGIHDPLCGMKAYRIEVYKKLGHFDSYDSIGTELAIYAAKNNKRIVQLPIKTRKRVDEPRFFKKYSANVLILRALWLACV